MRKGTKHHRLGRMPEGCYTTPGSGKQRSARDAGGVRSWCQTMGDQGTGMVCRSPTQHGGTRLDRRTANGANGATMLQHGDREEIRNVVRANKEKSNMKQSQSRLEIRGMKEVGGWRDWKGVDWTMRVGQRTSAINGFRISPVMTWPN